MPKKNEYPVPDTTGYINPKTKEYSNLKALSTWHDNGSYMWISFEKKANFCKNFGRDVWELYEELHGFWKGNNKTIVRLSTLLFMLEWGKDKYYTVVEKAEKFGILKAESIGNDGVEFTCLLDYRGQEKDNDLIPRGTFPIDYCEQAYNYVTTPHIDPNNKKMSLKEYKKTSRKLNAESMS